MVHVQPWNPEVPALWVDRHFDRALATLGEGSDNTHNPKKQAYVLVASIMVEYLSSFTYQHLKVKRFWIKIKKSSMP